MTVFTRKWLKNERFVQMKRVSGLGRWYDCNGSLVTVMLLSQRSPSGHATSGALVTHADPYLKLLLPFRAPHAFGVAIDHLN